MMRSLSPASDGVTPIHDRPVGIGGSAGSAGAGVAGAGTSAVSARAGSAASPSPTTTGSPAWRSQLPAVVSRPLRRCRRAQREQPAQRVGRERERRRARRRMRPRVSARDDAGVPGCARRSRSVDLAPVRLSQIHRRRRDRAGRQPLEDGIAAPTGPTAATSPMRSRSGGQPTGDRRDGSKLRVIYSVRLEAPAHQITEIESIAVRRRGAQRLLYSRRHAATADLLAGDRIRPSA